MSRDYREYLEDILEACARITRYAANLDLVQFEADTLYVDAVLHNLMIVGEAVKNIPDEIRTKMPDIKWQEIGKFRDVVVHHYFNVVLPIVWNIIKNYLPPLQVQVAELLQILDEDES